MLNHFCYTCVTMMSKLYIKKSTFRSKKSGLTILEKEVPSCKPVMPVYNNIS